MPTSVTAEPYSLPALAGLIRLSTLVPLSADHTAPLPVLLVITNRQDFCYEEYVRVRHELAARGLGVVVAVDSADAAAASDDGRAVAPDVALDAVSAGDYSAMLLVGGGHASLSRYVGTFPRAWDSSAHQSDPFAHDAIHQLIARFVAQHKPVAAYSDGVSTLAWTGVDCLNPLKESVLRTSWESALRAS